VKAYDIDSENTMERWHNKLYEVSTMRCAWVTKVVRWIGFELCDAPRFNGTGLVDIFLTQMEKVVLKDKRVQTMDAVVRGTPMRWWETHYTNL
jgi:hypothetical protein